MPGKPGESELIARVESHDPESQMPPKKFGKPLSPGQVASLRRWVEQGATWTRHWAFKPPVKPVPPVVKDAAWPVNEVDRFILDRLDDEGLRPEAEASRTALIRRVTLDLTGLPPTPEDVNAFLADRSARAYEDLVDRLLDSPRYGEHMARFWLDAARYGDTHGLHLDNYREIWPYRDWVIRAFNGNKPFDRFVVEQLAGDLLRAPEPGPDRRHRLQPLPRLDQRGGLDRGGGLRAEHRGPGRYQRHRVHGPLDRLRPLPRPQVRPDPGQGLLPALRVLQQHRRAGPRRQLGEVGAGRHGADRRPARSRQVPRRRDRGAREVDLGRDDEGLIRPRGRARSETRDADAPYVGRSDFVWVNEGLPPGASPQGDGQFVGKPGHPVYSGRLSLVNKARGLSQWFFDNAGRKLVVGEGDVLFGHVYLDPKNAPREVMLQWHTAGGWSHRAYWGENAIDFGKDGTPERLAMGKLPELGRWVRLEVPVNRLKLAPGTVIEGWAFTQQGGTVHWDAAGITSRTPQDGQPFDSFAAWVQAQRAAGAAGGLPGDLKAAVQLDRSKWTEAQARALAAYFVEHADADAARSVRPLRDRLAEAEKKRKAIEAQAPTTLVFRERAGEPKPAYLLKRGEYELRGEKVGRGVPAFLPPLPPGEPVNRLGLARWLVAPDHPLTARVAVNRLWLQVFGTGIVKTAEDFGSQGEPPSHPELLDWLAVQFREDGWDVKRMMKRLVMSAAYRQSSRVAPRSWRRTRRTACSRAGRGTGSTPRCSATRLLFVGGLLVEHVGGPSVKPPQPSGLWEAVGYTASNTAKFVADRGPEKVHRRSLYIFWKRTSAPPQMTTFDAPSREACTVRRERTNTPLQALLLMNEPQMIEASRAGRSGAPRGRGRGLCVRGRGSGLCRRPRPAHADVPIGRRPVPGGRRARRARIGPGRLPRPLSRPARRRQEADPDRREPARPGPRPARAGRLDDGRQRHPQPR